MLTDKISATRKEVPNEPGCWFELRQVSGDELDEAQARFQQRTMTMEISQGMAQAMTNIPRGTQDAVDLTVERCDKGTLLRYGLVGWGGPGYDGEPCNDQRKGKLDAGTRDWAAAEIFRLSYITKGEASRSEPSGTDGVNPASGSEQSGAPSPTLASSSRSESSRA